MHWHKALAGYGMGDGDDADPADPDLQLLPGILEKVILPKLSGTTVHQWPGRGRPRPRLDGPLNRRVGARLVGRDQRRRAWRRVVGCIQ